MGDGSIVRSLHLFSERKFIPWIRRTFTLPGWSADFIVLDPRRKKYSEILEDGVLVVSSDTFGQQYIRQELQHTDIAFHYLLDNIKSEIILNSPAHVLHCWCFFGAEVYQQTPLFRSQLYAPYTRGALWTLPEIKFRYEFRKWYYTLALGKRPPLTSLKNAIPHIHCLLWYIEKEIQWIGRTLTLPPWKYFQFFSFSDIVPQDADITDFEASRILIGNSATIENNHLDILNVLQKLNDGQYTFTLPLTYGQFPKYKKSVKSRFSKILKNKVEFIEAHLELQVYYSLLKQHPTAVFLHYRQQGLGNILYLLYTGTKVYLSKNNIVLEWLWENQIEVFVFEDEFERDYKQSNLKLQMPVVLQNRSAVRKLLEHDRNSDTIAYLEKFLATAANINRT